MPIFSFPGPSSARPSSDKSGQVQPVILCPLRSPDNLQHLHLYSTLRKRGLGQRRKAGYKTEYGGLTPKKSLFQFLRIQDSALACSPASGWPFSVPELPLPGPSALSFTWEHTARDCLPACVSQAGFSKTMPVMSKTDVCLF